MSETVGAADSAELTLLTSKSHYAKVGGRAQRTASGKEWSVGAGGREVAKVILHHVVGTSTTDRRTEVTAKAATKPGTPVVSIEAIVRPQLEGQPDDRVVPIIIGFAAVALEAAEKLGPLLAQLDLET